MKNVVAFLGLTACLVFAVVPGCSDKGTNPVPTELIGTWWYVSSSMDGVPDASYSEVANTQYGDTASVIFNSDRTWVNYEYDDTQNLVFTQSGTYSADADSLTMTTILRAGAPVNPPRVQTAAYVVAGITMTMTATVDLGGTDHDLVISYIKE